MDLEAKQHELRQLKARVRSLEAEIAQEEMRRQGVGYPPREFYATYHATAGFVMGMVGAATSLLFNIIGSLLAGQDPLMLIRVYLTFPLGEEALAGLPGQRGDLALAIGCLLYMFTGMVLGVPFHLVLKRWFDRDSLGKRFLVVTVMALALWVINFYALLSWLQPLLIGGEFPGYIVAHIPWYVGAATHLVFGWTILLLEPFSTFATYKHPAEGR